MSAWPKEKILKIILVLILLWAGVTRLYRLNYPTSYYFDEVYHASTAKLIARNNPQAYQWWNPPPEPDTAIDWLHPPLAKLTQALSIKIWGAKSLGWRFSSAIFGIGLIYLIYLFTTQLGFSKETALLAAGLASLDGLLLTMSRIAMNDIHVTFFILLSWYFYWRWKKKPAQPGLIFYTALASGAALASKWSGIFCLLPILADLIIIPFLYQQKKATKAKIIFTSQQFRQFALWAPRLILTIGLVVPLTYVLSYGQAFWQGQSWQHLYKLHQQIWWYQTHLEATHPYQSVPWQWIFNWRPVYAFTAQLNNQVVDIYLQGNHLLFWSGAAAILAVLLSPIINYWHPRFLKKSEQAALFWLASAYFAVWFAWIFSPRIMFFYHYAPAVTTLSIVLAIWLSKIFQLPWGKWLVIILVGLIFGNFLIFYPHWTALPVSENLGSILKEIYYFWPSWR